MPLQPGTTLGPYSVTAKIGESGMGVDAAETANARWREEGEGEAVTKTEALISESVSLALEELGLADKFNITRASVAKDGA